MLKFEIKNEIINKFKAVQPHLKETESEIAIPNVSESSIMIICMIYDQYNDIIPKHGCKKIRL